jgi:hypothetical protein
VTNPNSRFIAIVLDRSGSMQSVKTDTEGGLKAFLDAQRDAPGDTTVSLYQFDTEHETVYENLALDQVPEYKLIPRGGTALLDAIGFTVAAVKAKIKALGPDDRPGEVIMVILTDGEENSSREYTLPAVKKLIEKRREKGWQVLFLGADQDAITVAANMGIGAGQTIAYASAHTASTMTSAGHMVARGTASGLYEFTDDERSAAL